MRSPKSDFDRLGDDRLLVLEVLDELERPLDPHRTRVHAVHRLARIEPRDRLLTDEPREEPFRGQRQVVFDRQLVAQRAEGHQHLQVRDEALGQGQFVLRG